MSKVFTLCLALSAVLALMAGGSSLGADADYDAYFRGGQELQKAGKPAEARMQYEKALSLQGLTDDQSGRALLAVAECFGREYKWLPARQSLEKALALKGASDDVRIKARIALGGIYQNYGDWAKVKAEYAEALKIAAIPPEQRVTVQKGLVKALVNLREFAAARDIMRELMGTPREIPAAPDASVPRVVLPEFVAKGVAPDAERAALQVAIAKTLMCERNYPEARAELLKAQTMPGLTAALKAEVQLYIGLSYYEAGDYERAKPELTKVPAMPGADARPPWDGGRMGCIPAREATLRLRFRKLIPEEGKTLKVLFIGSSHTLRENIPDLVTRLAASAPGDGPRIIAGDYVRMGTNAITFWNAGDTPDTARGVIAADPWDAVVFETFYNMSSADVMKYGALFADLIRAQKAVPVIYESPLPRASAYPERFRKYHDDNLALARSQKIPLAPAVAAWMEILGPKPTDEQFGVVYADWIHAAPKGAYMTACCIYSALTGRSPVGLYRPAGMSEADARVLQDAAWKAFQESNADVK